MLLEVYALTDLSDLCYSDLIYMTQTFSQFTKLFISFGPTTSVFIQCCQVALNRWIYLTILKISMYYYFPQTFNGAPLHLKKFF